MDAALGRCQSFGVENSSVIFTFTKKSYITLALSASGNQFDSDSYLFCISSWFCVTLQVDVRFHPDRSVSSCLITLQFQSFYNTKSVIAEALTLSRRKQMPWQELIRGCRKFDRLATQTMRVLNMHDP